MADPLPAIKIEVALGLAVRAFRPTAGAHQLLLVDFSVFLAYPMGLFCDTCRFSWFLTVDPAKAGSPPAQVACGGCKLHM